MIKNFKFLVIMLGLVSMTSISLLAKPVTSAQSNVLTYVQADDEMFELEGEEGDFDFYDAEEASETKKVEKRGTTFGDIISWILMGIIVIGLIYGIHYLRNNSITIENHPVIYVSLSVFKFSFIVGLLGWILFFVMSSFDSPALQTLAVVITALAIVIYAVYQSYKSYAHIELTTTKVLVTIASIALGLTVAFAAIPLFGLMILWYLIKDKLGWDKYVLSDGTEIRRVNSLSNQYEDKYGHRYERISDGTFVKI